MHEEICGRRKGHSGLRTYSCVGPTGKSDFVKSVRHAQSSACWAAFSPLWGAGAAAAFVLMALSHWDGITTKQKLHVILPYPGS